MIATFLGGLESVFSWLLEASWQASVLAALVLSLQWALRGRLNPRWHHTLWLLVVARLVLPILPESTLSLFQFTPSPPPAIARTVTEPFFAAPPELPSLLRSVPAPPTQYPYSAFTALALTWLAGAFGLLILTWQVNRRFAWHVASAPRITDPRLLKLATTAQNELGIRRNLRIIESTQVQSPAIMGLFRPTLILPTEVGTRFSDGELRFIFLHEFAHLKRGDLLLQWLIALLQIIHWFNPVLWYAFRRMRADREPATDALVLNRAGEEQKEPYGQVLVKLLEHYHQRHSLPTLVGILEDKDQFKRRFSLIARFTRGAYGWSLLGVLIIGILSVVCLTKSKATKTAATVDSKPTAASVSVPPVDASKRQVQLEFKLVQIDEKTYISYQKKIDAEVANSDLASLINQINNLPGVSLLSAPSVTTQDGLKANVDIVREMPYATQFDKDKDGKIVPSDFKTRNVGLSIEGTPTLTADKEYVRLKFKCKLTSFEGWKEIPTGGRLPIFDTASTETERLIGKHGDAVWVGESGATRAYLTVGNGNNGPPSINDTASKRILLLVSARPVPAEAPSSTNADPTPLLLTAVQKGDSATVQNLINQGADPKAVDKDGRTLLFDAGSPEVAQLLIADGVDVNTRDKSNDLALHNICRNGGKNASAIVGVLLQHGADPNSRAGQLGETPLMDARDGSTVDVLMEHGANPKITMASGENVFFWLSWSNPSALEALLRHGLPFNPKTDGATMLLHATWTHNIPPSNGFWSTVSTPISPAYGLRITVILT